MLAGRALVAGHVRAVVVDEGDRAGDAVRAVLRHLDHRRPARVVVDLRAGLLLVDGIAEGSGRAVPDRPDDLVHPAAAGSDERLLAAVEDGGEPVGAQARVLAGASVVEDGHLLTHVGVPPVRDPAGVLGVGEADLGVGAVAEGLELRATAATERHLRPHRQGPAEPVVEAARVGHQIGAVGGRLDLGGQSRLQGLELGQELGRVGRLSQLDRQVLQRRGGLDELRRIAEPDPELGRGPRQPWQPPVQLPGGVRLRAVRPS